jgi:hypothetical protein
MVAFALGIGLVLLATAGLSGCVIVTERPVDSAPAPSPATVTQERAAPLAASGGSPTTAVTAAFVPAAAGGPGTPEAPAALPAGGAPSSGPVY